SQPRQLRQLRRHDWISAVRPTGISSSAATTAIVRSRQVLDLPRSHRDFNASSSFVDFVRFVASTVGDLVHGVLAPRLALQGATTREFSRPWAHNSETETSVKSVPVHAFFGEKDRRLMVLRYQWTVGRTIAWQRGFRNLTRTIVRGAGHSPFP